MLPLLVGELNPANADPKFALWPDPPGCAGHRLMMILGLTEREYLAKFRRTNLCTGKWSEIRATDAMRSLEGDALVILGTNVRRVFGLSRSVWFSESAGFNGRRIFVLPHPSGLCRVWNDPGSEKKARTLLREFL